MNLAINLELTLYKANSINNKVKFQIFKMLKNEKEKNTIKKIQTKK